ncbi:MAG: Na/Pi cotransporter family protein [Proteobacteria bacterium]|nr:Na/Pi cotransporter family protein [Pseudomonadota bacterium]
MLTGTFLLFIFALPALAEVIPGTDDIDWFTLAMGLLGGLAMFLFGMEQMSDGLKAAAGNSLKDVLSHLTKNRFLGAITGAFVTATLNSSSVTTVLVVGFISAGFMTLTQSVGVIMGANVGTTITAQIVAFNVTQYALMMIAVGFLMMFTGKAEKTRHYGSIVMGLGLVFYGMGVMGDAMLPLHSYQPFLDLMIKMENPLLGILIGAVFTGLVQSSSATTGIAIVMASSGLITLPAGIALAFGSNIGTCVTAILASLGKPVEAVRAAMVHVIFNIAGVMLWFLFIPQLADFVVAISPSSPELSGKSQMVAEVPRQIANAHTVFNVANTLLFIGFTPFFARLVKRLVPDRPIEEKIIIEPRYLDKDVVDVPAMALEQVRFELGHIGEIINDMYSSLRSGMQQKNKQKLDAVQKLDNKVGILSDAVLEYLRDIRQQPLTDKQSNRFQALMSATMNLENLADIINNELVEIGKNYINLGADPSEATGLLVDDLADNVAYAVDQVIQAIREDDETAAEEVITLKDEVHRIAEEFLIRQSKRLGIMDGGHLNLVRLEMEFLDKLRNIYNLTKRIAKDFVPEEVANKV